MQNDLCATVVEEGPALHCSGIIGMGVELPTFRSAIRCAVKAVCYCDEGALRIYHINSIWPVVGLQRCSFEQLKEVAGQGTLKESVERGRTIQRPC